MLHTDLEEVTSRQLRLKLEADMKMDLSEYKGFLDQQTLFIYGQLKEPSKIHDYLYLVNFLMHMGVCVCIKGYRMECC